MRIATWNVNSIKVRIGQVTDWLQASATDVLLMQETKCTDEAFPAGIFREAGFVSVLHGQKTYNGVAIVLRNSLFSSVEEVIRGIPGYHDGQARLVSAIATAAGGERIRFVSAYFPNGQEVGCSKYLYKLEWISALTGWVRRLAAAGGPPIVLGGDFNIAPRDEDVWDPASWSDCILVSRPERNAWRELTSSGVIDTWQLGLHPPGTFSWWDYRHQAFDRNQGLRIDHLLASTSLAAGISNVRVDTAPRTNEKPSDHAPVVLDVDCPVKPQNRHDYCMD